MSDVIALLLEENKRLQGLLNDAHLDLVRFNANPNKAVLYAKKAEVMGLLSRRIKETGEHQQGWKYATSEDVKDAVRKAMAAAGLSLAFEIISYEMDRGDKKMIITAKIAFTLQCSESGETETHVIVAEAIDFVRGGGSVADKTFFKLYTTAEKYFLKTTFLIASGDEVDNDSDEISPQEVNDTPPLLDNRPWQQKNPPLEKFLEMAIAEFGIEEQDVKDELKAAGFTGYKPGDAVKMWKILEDARAKALRGESENEEDSTP